MTREFNAHFHDLKDISPQPADSALILSFWASGIPCARIQGAIITQVDPASPSVRQGLQPGDLILEMDRQPVRNAEEAVRLSEEIKGPKVMVRIWRDGRSQYLVIDESME
ncbi:MAG TPA: PDZ domain-containing protein [Opitutus sp.]|nr:PDZ domain-containing protein [Opitutus sp.]